MAFVGKLVASVDSNTRGWSRGMGTVRKDLGGLAKLGGKLGAVVAPLLTTAALVGAVQRIDGVNQALARSTSIMPDLTAAQKESLATQARLIGLQQGLATSARDAGAAYQYLFAAGKSLTHTQAELGHVLRFAQAGNFDAALATDLLTDAQSALGMSVKDVVQDEKNLVRLSDVLIRANTLANASAEQFSTSLTTKAGGALRILGKDVEEGVAVLAAMADQGVKAEEAGTQLGIVLRDLTTKAIENAAAFEDVEIAVFDELGEMRNLADVVGDLESALDGMSDATKKATLLNLGFSDKSLGTLQTIIGTSDKIREYEKGLRAAGGMTEIVASNKLTKLEKALARVTQVMDNLLQIVGAEAVESFAEWVDGATRTAEGINGIGESLAEVLDFVHALRIAWKGFSIAVNTLVAEFVAFAGRFVPMMEAISNAIPGVDIGSETSDFLKAMGEGWRADVAESRKEIGQLMDEWPSDKIKSAVAELARAATSVPELGAAATDGVGGAATRSVPSQPSTFDELFAEERAETLSELQTFADSIRDTMKDPLKDFQEHMRQLRAAQAEGFLSPAEVARSAAEKREALLSEGPGGEMREFAKSVTDSVQTPMERFVTEQTKLAEARKFGLSDEAFQRATQRNVRDVLDQTEGATFEPRDDPRAKGTEAIDARSSQALAAIRESLFGGQDPQKETVKLTKLGVQQQRIMAQTLASIDRKLGTGPPVASLRGGRGRGRA